MQLLETHISGIYQNKCVNLLTIQLVSIKLFPLNTIPEEHVNVQVYLEALTSQVN